MPLSVFSVLAAREKVLVKAQLTEAASLQKERERERERERE